MRKFLVSALSVISVVSFATVVFAGSAGNGKKLFNAGANKCKTCHKLSGKKKVGPGLKGVTKRRSEKWLTKWLKNPQKTWEENDAETQKLKQWKKGRAGKKKTSMKGFKPLSDSAIADIIAFLKKNDG